MAKRRASTTRRATRNATRPQGPGLIRRHLRELVGIGLLALGILAGLALISYHPTDPSFNTQSAEPVRNWIGPFGAMLSDALFQLLGVTSFVTAGMALVFGGRLLLRRRSPVRWPELAGLAAMVVLAALLGQLLVGSVMFREEPLHTGGALGRILGELLVGFLGRAGAIVAAVTALLVTLKLALDISFAETWSWLRGPARDALTAVGRGFAWAWRRLGAGLAETRCVVRARLVDLRQDRARRRAAARARRAAARTGAEEDSGDGAPDAEDVDGSLELLAAEEQESLQATVESRELIQVPPRIVRHDTVADQVTGEAGAGAGTPDSSEVISLDRLDQVESGERSAVGAEDRPPAPETGAGDAPVAVAVEVEDDAPASGASAAIGDEATAAHGAQARIVESEHMKADSKPDVDSLRRWSADVSFHVPPLTLLDPLQRSSFAYSEEELHGFAHTLEKKLRDYGVQGHVKEIHPGPVVTMYEFEPAPGVKISRIAGLADDLSMALKAVKVRIVAPLPGKGVVGVEVPNKHRQTVYIRDVLAQDADTIGERQLPIVLGKDIVGKPQVADWAKMPHLLIAGTTGSGKSVAVNGMLTTLLLTRTPEEVRMILIDPKMIEFSTYEDIPHLLLPVVTDARKASAALRWAVQEMTRRYELLRTFRKRNLQQFNREMARLRESWERDGDAGLPWDPSSPDAPFAGPPEELPLIVIVIDELADLMMVARKDVEDSIVRLAQMARAAGIHMMIATQRPSVDVITGLIKANFPARISFKVSSKVDSRTVLDSNGAEHLLGMGDMLLLKPGTSSLQRIHAPLVTVEEINRICEALREQAAPMYLEHVLDPGVTEGDGSEPAEEADELYDRAVAIVAESRKASTSMLQRRLKIGYNRAARIIEAMEEEGVVGPADGVKPREVFVQPFGADA